MSVRDVLTEMLDGDWLTWMEKSVVLEELSAMDTSENFWKLNKLFTQIPILCYRAKKCPEFEPFAKTFVLEMIRNTLATT